MTSLTHQINSTLLIKKAGVIAIVIGDHEIGFFDRNMQYFGDITPVSQYVMGLLSKLNPNEDHYPKLPKVYPGITRRYIRSVTTKWYNRDRSSYYKALDEYLTLPESKGDSPEYVVQFIKSKMREETEKYLELDKQKEQEEQAKPKPTFFQRLFGY